MDGLEALTSNIGPGMSAYNAGVETTRKYEAQKSEQALRQAQMQEILQNVAQREQMNPLNLQAKRQDIAANEAKQRADQHAYMTKVTGELIPKLEALPNVPGVREAYFTDALAKAGVPLDQADSQYFKQQPDLVKALKKQHEWAVTQTPEYRKSMDTAVEHSRSAEKVARINAQSREAVSASRSKGVQSIQEAVKSGKMTAEKAAVSLYGAAQFETDPVEQQKLMNMAKQYEQFAMNERNAQAGGKVDVGAAANLPTVNIPSAFGGGPAKGTAANPIVLK